jgi:hypothetical protein
MIFPKLAFMGAIKRNKGWIGLGFEFESWLGMGAVALGLGFAANSLSGAETQLKPQPDPPLRAVLLAPAQATPERLSGLKTEGKNAVVLFLEETNGATARVAADRVGSAGLNLYYWIEVGRNPVLAAAHPEWMASIQSHPEWRRFHPDFPPTKKGEMVKAYPWVPALYKETFPVQLDRVRRLMAELPPARGLFLNDLQGPPSACGCGHPLCRWTTDYGPLHSATRLPADAAARFVREVKRLAPSTRIIPVWATECEEEDRDNLCGGVGCYAGTCWREWTAQVTPLARESGSMAVLALFREFQRDLPRYGSTGGWVQKALRSFVDMPKRYQVEGVPPQRLLAVLQGWNATPHEIEAQISQAEQAGAAGWIVAQRKIEQSWEPRIFELGK